MSNYTITTDFSTKDGLSPGDTEKVIRGADFDTEFENIRTAVNSKADSGTTLASYGITDAYTQTQVDALTWDFDTDITGKPTTLAGYGITDAASTAQGALAASALQPGDNISELTNNSGYITDYSVTESDVTAHEAAIDAGSVDGYDVSVVSSLPGTPDSTTIYFVTG
jgi:hypothetical protein